MIIENQFANADQARRVVADHGITFFDFGCSAGAGMGWVQSKIESVGLGFDIDTRKLALADAAGFACCNQDILGLPDERMVSFTILFHLLEHLDSHKLALNFIEKACTVSKDYVYIKQPFCDADSQLFHLGLQTFYSNWTGHPNLMATPQFFHILDDLRKRKIIREFLIGYKKPILSSGDPIIHPIESPVDCHEFDEALHPSKDKSIVLDFPLFYEIMIEIDVGGGGYGPLWRCLSPEEVVFDSRKGRSSRNSVARHPPRSALPEPARMSRNVYLYLRDDDFTKPTKNFDRLEEISGKYKNTLLAAIPGRLGVSDDDVARIKENFWIAQHGYVHKNHQDEKIRSEFPEIRSKQDIEHDVRNGKRKIEECFGVGSCVHFVAPWNRYATSHFDSLIENNFESYHGLGTVSHYKGMPLIGYCINFTQLYLKCRGDYNELLYTCIELIDGYIKIMSRKFDCEKFYIPINTHHLQMDEPQFMHLRNLLNDLSQMLDYRSCSPIDAVTFCRSLALKG